MPLFSKKPAVVPEHRSTLFSRRDRSPSPARQTSNLRKAESPRRGLLHRHEDPSILAARERVVNAERMEKEADRALVAARLAVREARDHIKMLEKEAKEQARLAKIKQHQAKSISKRGHGLGRHGPV